MTGEDAWRCWDCRSLLDPQWKRCPYCTSTEFRREVGSSEVIVEGIARAIHDANTGRITSDDSDPVNYRNLAVEAEKMARALLFARAANLLDWQASEHGENIADYTDLLRAWDTDGDRWERGC